MTILDLTCGASRITGWLDVSRAAQLSTGIWEAAGASQQLQDRAAPPAERNAGHLPGHSPWLYAQIHGRPDRQNEILIDPVGHPREITQEGVST